MTERDQIIELRCYQVKPGLMREWIDAFNNEVIPINKDNGAHLLGSGINSSGENEFIWFRAFKNAEHREKTRLLIYEGLPWLKIQDRIRGMLDNRSETLLENNEFWEPYKYLIKNEEKKEIQELRTYVIESGRMSDWIRLFNTKIAPLHFKYDVSIHGSFIPSSDPDKFVWVRSFKDEEHKKMSNKDIYQGKEWSLIQESVRDILKDYSDIKVIRSINWFED